LRRLQEVSQINCEVAWVCTEGFLRGAFAEAGALQVIEDLFGDGCRQALEPAADGRFMHTKELRDLQQSALIEKVGREKKAIVEREGLECSGDGGL
jgi:hypothetical protein